MGFTDNLREIFGKGAESTKNAVTKAGSAIQDFSDKSVLKLDIKKLESERKNIFAELGEYTSQVLVSLDTVSKSDEKIVDCLLRISQVNEKIAAKEKALSEV
ncbi:MAG: hypothetical protein MJ185_12285 [Treponema sp.]|nr:hypothetical protein [Treponema sp.]